MCLRARRACPWLLLLFLVSFLFIFPTNTTGVISSNGFSFPLSSFVPLSTNPRLHIFSRVLLTNPQEGDDIIINHTACWLASQLANERHVPLVTSMSARISTGVVVLSWPSLFLFVFLLSRDLYHKQTVAFYISLTQLPTRSSLFWGLQRNGCFHLHTLIHTLSYFAQTESPTLKKHTKNKQTYKQTSTNNNNRNLA